MVEHSGRFVSYGFDTIVASITTDAVAADSMTTASISSLEFHVSVSYLYAPGRSRNGFGDNRKALFGGDDKLGVGHDHLRFHLVGVERLIDGRERGSDAGDGQHRHHELDAVRGADPDHIVRLQSALDQSRSQRNGA